jgi:hypothetical protein
MSSFFRRHRAPLPLTWGSLFHLLYVREKSQVASMHEQERSEFNGQKSPFLSHLPPRGTPPATIQLHEAFQQVTLSLANGCIELCARLSIRGVYM